MEVVRDIFAGSAIRSVLHLAKGIGGTGGHRTGLATGEVVENNLQATRCIMQSGDDLVTRIHEEVGGRVGCIG